MIPEAFGAKDAFYAHGCSSHYIESNLACKAPIGMAFGPGGSAPGQRVAVTLRCC